MTDNKLAQTKEIFAPDGFLAPAVADDYMLQAFKAAQNSTCARRRVGAVIVSPEGDQIISIGFNHSSNGLSCETKFFKEYAEMKDYKENAELEWFLLELNTYPFKAHLRDEDLSPELRDLWKSFLVFTKSDEFKAVHKDWQNTEIHSELSAILNAYKIGCKSLSNCILFSSRSPCIPCAHAIIEAGISMVYYTELSIAGEGGIPILEQAGVKLKRIEVKHDYWT